MISQARSFYYNKHVDLALGFPRSEVQSEIYPGVRKSLDFGDFREFGDFWILITWIYVLGFVILLDFASARW